MSRRAAATLVIYVSSISTFIARLCRRRRLGLLRGCPLPLTGGVLPYLLIAAPGQSREALYVVQVGLMPLWILVLQALDYGFKVDFRRNRAAVACLRLSRGAGPARNGGPGVR